MGVYVGASAGSMCAGQSISVAFWKGWDDPGYGKEWDLQHYGYNGLDLLPRRNSVFPHYGPQWRELVESKRREFDHEVVALDEDHAYLVHGDYEELLSCTAKCLLMHSGVSPLIVLTLPKPLGIVLEDRDAGLSGGQVAALQEGGNAWATSLIRKDNLLVAVCGQDARSLNLDVVMDMIAAAPQEVSLS